MQRPMVSNEALCSSGMLIWHPWCPSIFFFLSPSISSQFLTAQERRGDGAGVLVKAVLATIWLWSIFKVSSVVRSSHKASKVPSLWTILSFLRPLGASIPYSVCHTMAGCGGFSRRQYVHTWSQLLALFWFV